MKAAKKRFYKREPAFWKVLKDEHKPKKDWVFNMDINSLYAGQLNILLAKPSGGKSVFFDKMFINSVYGKTFPSDSVISYESSEEKISQIRTTGMEIIKSRTSKTSDWSLDRTNISIDNRLE